MMILAAIIENEIFPFYIICMLCMLCSYCTLLDHYWISILFFFHIEFPSKKANKLIVYGSLIGNYPYLSGKYIQLINNTFVVILVVIPVCKQYLLLVISCFILVLCCWEFSIINHQVSRCDNKMPGYSMNTTSKP